jgi:hypothetical protein
MASLLRPQVLPASSGIGSEDSRFDSSRIHRSALPLQRDHGKKDGYNVRAVLRGSMDVDRMLVATVIIETPDGSICFDAIVGL